MVVYSMHLMIDNDTMIDAGLQYTDYNMLKNPTAYEECSLYNYLCRFLPAS